MNSTTPQDHGFIALGKYSSARDSILHFMCEAEWSNGSFGDVEAPTGYVWRISNDPADVHIPNTEVTSLLEEWFTANPEVTDSPALRDELVGHFLVTEDSQGHIYVMTCPSATSLASEYVYLENRYEAWTAQDED